MSEQLPAWFEATLRRHLPDLSADLPLEADQPLTGYGLNSLGWVGLVADLGDRVHIPDELLMPSSFRTATTLYQVVQEVESG